MTHPPQAAPLPHRHSLRRYVRSHLHRRLFVWFGASIVVTAVVATAVTALLGRSGESGWAREVERARVFARNQFEAVWEDPPARTALAEAAARDLQLGVVVEDAAGRVLSSSGAGCPRPRFEVDVRRQGTLLGRVKACTEGRGGAPWRGALILLSAVAVLWAASGKISRRLTQPLAELVRTVGEIGRGNLAVRASVSCRAPDELGVVAEAVNDMAARIEKQLADQRELLAGVSHELRTPLSRIRIVSEMLREQGADARWVAELDREVVEMDSLVGQLLASSRIDFAAMNLRPLDPVDLATRALERAGLDAAKLDLGPELGAFQGDATLLARALANLLENAARHGGGLTRLWVRREGGALQFVVEDRGPGIPQGREEAIFLPFHRSGGGRTEGALGLGLSLVRRIAHAHQGRAYAQARAEGGARFVLEVPA